MARNGNDTEVSLVFPLHHQPGSYIGGRPAAGKAQERTLESDCRALPTLLCPEHLQDFVVQAFLELIQLTVYMTNGQLVALHKAYLKCPL